MWMLRWVLTKCGRWRSVKGRRMPTDPPVVHSLPTTHINHHHQLSILGKEGDVGKVSKVGEVDKVGVVHSLQTTHINHHLQLSVLAFSTFSAYVALCTGTYVIRLDHKKHQDTFPSIFCVVKKFCWYFFNCLLIIFNGRWSSWASWTPSH